MFFTPFIVVLSSICLVAAYYPPVDPFRPSILTPKFKHKNKGGRHSKRQLTGDLINSVTDGLNLPASTSTVAPAASTGSGTATTDPTTSLVTTGLLTATSMPSPPPTSSQSSNTSSPSESVQSTVVVMLTMTASPSTVLVDRSSSTTSTSSPTSTPTLQQASRSASAGESFGSRRQEGSLAVLMLVGAVFASL